MQQWQKHYYNKSAKALALLEVGDSVCVQTSPHGAWNPAMVVAHSEQPRSYTVKTEEGSVIRRNRKHISDRSQNSPDIHQCTPRSALPQKKSPIKLAGTDYMSPVESHHKWCSSPL
jgi:hypothetical protein